MAVHNFVGDAFRGATWISLHNGGGVGWGEAINGGFGMYIDGSKKSKRRSNPCYIGMSITVSQEEVGHVTLNHFAIKRAMEDNADLNVTLPHIVDEALLSKHVK